MRVRFVMLPTLIGEPATIPLLLETVVPLEYIHCIVEGLLTSTVQVTLNMSPAIPVPDSENVIICRISGEKSFNKTLLKSNRVASFTWKQYPN